MWLKNSNSSSASPAQHSMTQWVKLNNCQWAFGEEKILEWLSKFGKPLTPLEGETYKFGNDDKDN
jgi:hypothetical protein